MLSKHYLYRMCEHLLSRVFTRHAWPENGLTQEKWSKSFTGGDTSQVATTPFNFTGSSSVAPLLRFSLVCWILCWSLLRFALTSLFSSSSALIPQANFALRKCKCKVWNEVTIYVIVNVSTCQEFWAWPCFQQVPLNPRCFELPPCC